MKTLHSTAYKYGAQVSVEVWDGEWRPGVVIGIALRANGQTFYRISVRKLAFTPYVTAKRLRALRPAEA
jgi:hypothetical protein